MTKGLRQVFTSVAAFAVVLLALALADQRLRERVTELASGNGLTSWSRRATDLGGALTEAFRHQSIENAPLLVFVAVGAVLFLLMVKT